MARLTRDALPRRHIGSKSCERATRHDPNGPGTALAVGLVSLAVTMTLALLPPDAGGQPPPEERRFWVQDKHPYTSPWYRGEHRRMINFGCTRAPYYPDSPRCADDRGCHHGIDVAMRCGNPLFAGLAGRVVHPRSSGALGPAYGANAFRIRNAAHDIDVVIGHTRRVFVRPGDRVERGQRIALASDAAAPDGCHLHFEVRPAGDGYHAARKPARWFDLDRQPID